MFKCWLTEVKGKNHSAYCKGCKKEITAVLTALRKYHSSAYHQTRIRELQLTKFLEVNDMKMMR
jgi:hypothetical protein